MRNRCGFVCANGRSKIAFTSVEADIISPSVPTCACVAEDSARSLRVTRRQRKAIVNRFNEPLATQPHHPLTPGQSVIRSAPIVPEIHDQSDPRYNYAEAQALSCLASRDAAAPLTINAASINA